ncbi:MAG TPA: hypothetical protein VJ876_06215 [Bacteroidales bacterium]|nr:hypothetical protein [Bacteroidales bacterium]
MPDSSILYRLIAISAGVVIAGMILSGGPAVFLVARLHPQPEWVDVATFIEHYHPMQLFPYAGGFILILGFTFFVASAYQLAVLPSLKVPAVLAIIFVSVFSMMIGLNYTLQIAWVPVLIRTQDPLLAMVTMHNPQSVAWSLEVFGFGFLGLSTWCISLVFWGSKRMSIIRYLLVANGFVSIASAIIATGEVAWFYDPAGIVAYVSWNLLIIVTMALIYVEFRRRRLKGGV